MCTCGYGFCLRQRGELNAGTGYIVSDETDMLERCADPFLVLNGTEHVEWSLCIVQ